MKMVHMDMRRVWRSVLDLAHARRDALSPSGRMADKPGRAFYRSRGTSVSRDLYGRMNQEAFELYRKLSFDKMPPL